jgi:hypothetical protein
MITVGLLIIAMEGLFFVGGKMLQKKWGMWRVPRPPEEAREDLTFDQYMEYRDPILGWPYPREYGRNLDVNGAHPNPHFPNGPRDGACVSLYGDSFTGGGDESEPAKGWANLLSKRFDCYVANFGVGGYGTDQAYLRFAKNQTDTSPVVVFGVHAGDTLRNLTRIRDFENYEMWYALKPRFVVDQQGELELIPIPNLTEEEYRRVMTVEGEQLILEHENLHPGGPAGVVKLEFPYTVAVVRNALKFYGLRSRILRYPEWMEFLQPKHPLGGLEIMVGISAQFVELAHERGKEALILILPHTLDFEYRETHEEWPYRHLVEAYEMQNLPFADFGPYLFAEMKRTGSDVSRFFGPTQHYNDEGNAQVASFVGDLLREGWH